MGFTCGNFVSQKRNTCCGICKSSATSLIVRNAFGAFLILALAASSANSWVAAGEPFPASTEAPAWSPAGVPGSTVIVCFDRETAIDSRLQDVARPEPQNAARQDRHFLTG